MDKKNTNEELEYFQNKLKETMGKDLPKKYLETTDLSEVDKKYEHKFKERIEKHMAEVDRIKNMIGDSKMKNIYLIPTHKPSRLRYNLSNVLVLTKESYKDYSKLDNIHIYITSNEPIKEGWSYDRMMRTVNKIDNVYSSKIILTTDQDLIKDGVQAIDDEFLEWFVNNPSCECVDVQKWASLAECGYSYHIIIPQEVPNLTDEKGRPMTYWGGLVETKQEALEEAYQRGYERGLNALIPLIENIQSEITKLKRNL